MFRGRWNRRPCPERLDGISLRVVVEGPQEEIGKPVRGTGGDLGFTRDGSHAQYLLLPQEAVSEKPTNLSFSEAATVGVSYVTAWSALCEVGAITEKDVVVIVERMVRWEVPGCQIAKWRGATVIGIVRHETQRQRVREVGADEVINTNQTAMREAVMDLTKGRGASLVFDTVGGALFEPCLQLLAQRGRQIEIAATSERRVSFDLRNFYHREARLFGVDSLQLDVSTASALLAKLRGGFETGAFAPSPIAKTYSLAQGQQAYEDVLHGREGKVVLMLR